MKTTKSVSIKGYSAAIITALFLLGGAAQARVNTSPMSVTFGKQAVGSVSAPVHVTLSNTSRQSFKIQSISLSSLQFTYSGPALPTTLRPGQSLSGTVMFSPTAAVLYRGTLSFVPAQGQGPSVNVPLSGTGLAMPVRPAAAPVSTPSGQLTVSSSSLSFGNATVGATASQVVGLSNSGNGSLTVTNVSISGAGFGASGIPAGLILSSGQTAILNVTFAPSGSGTFSGGVTISSTASNASLALALSGNGVAPAVTHSVALVWSSEASPVSGYNVYSGSAPGGPYNKLTTAPIGTTAYSDNGVQSGSTHYYAVTAVDPTGAESIFSNQVSVLVP